MRVIYKYNLDVGENIIKMPDAAILLSVQMQRGQITMWAEVNTNNDYIDKTFVVYGTGQEILKHGVYRGTVQASDFLVWHVYEIFQ